MNIIQLYPELFLMEPHTCCDKAGQYLIPPHNSGVYYPALGEVISFRHQDRWYIDLGDGWHKPDVTYCPWCGADLRKGNEEWEPGQTRPLMVVQLRPDESQEGE